MVRWGCWGLSEPTAGPVVGPSRRKTIVVLATPFVTSGCSCSSPRVYREIKSQMWSIISSTWRNAAPLPCKVMPQAVLRLSLFSGNSLARPLIVIHPSCAPVYKREIRISITRAQRQRDWCVSHRIPSVSLPSLCFRSEKWTLSSAMIRFSLHISIQDSVLSGWYTIPTRRQPAEGLWKSNIIRLFGLLDLLLVEWGADTFDETVWDNVTRPESHFCWSVSVKLRTGGWLGKSVQTGFEWGVLRLKYQLFSEKSVG